MDDEKKKVYVLRGWPATDTPMVPTSEGLRPALAPLPHSDRVREWLQAGKTVRVTFEIVDD